MWNAESLPNVLLWGFRGVEEQEKLKSLILENKYDMDVYLPLYKILKLSIIDFSAMLFLWSSNIMCRVSKAVINFKKQNFIIAVLDNCRLVSVHL